MLWIASMPALFVFLWSTGFIGAKFGLPYAEPYTFLSTRFAIVVVLLLIIAVATRAPWPSSRRLALHIAFSGLMINGFYLGGVFSALNHGMPVSLSALITGLQPALTALLAGPFLGEQISKRQWRGIALGFFGIFLVVFDKLALSTGNAAGVVFSVIALFGITIGAMYQKKYCTSMDLRTGSAIQFAVPAIFLFALAALFETRGIEWTGEFIFAMAWLVVILSLGAITLLMLLIRQGEAAKVGSLFYLVPPVTALLAFFAFGDTLGWLDGFGMALTVLGVALVTRE